MPYESSDQAPAASRDLQFIASGAGISLLGKVANGCLQFAYSLVLARLLNARYVGIFMLGLTIVKIAETLVRLGLDLGTVHFVAIANGEGKHAAIRGLVRSSIKLTLISSLAVAVPLVIVAPILANWFDMPELSSIIQILALSLPFMSVTMVLLAALLGLRNIASNVLGEKLALPSFILVSTLLLLLSGYGLTGASIGYLSGVLLTLPLVFFYLKRSLNGNETTVPPDTNRMLLHFSLPLLLFIFFNQVLIWTDTLILGLLRPAHEVGIYSVAMRTSIMASTILASINAIFAPMISDLYNRKDLVRLEYLFKTVSKWILLATLPIVLIIILLAKELMLLFGPDFTAGSNALIILALTQLASAGAGSVGFMLTMCGRQKIMMYNTLLICPLNIVLNLWLIPEFGMAGAAAATCVSIFALNILMLLQVFRYIRMHPYNTGYLKIIITGIGVFVLLSVAKFYLVELHYLYSITAYATLYLVLYAAILGMLGLDEEDSFIYTTLRRRVLRL